MKFDWFVIPFLAGLTFVFGFCCIKFYLWIQRLSRGEKALLKKHFFSPSLWVSIKEIFNESLLHRKIFRTNALLGYMHTSLAFGWFLLIVLGNIEVKFYSHYSVNPPYVPIFLNYFEPNTAPHFFGRGFRFLMDFLLLIILSGVALAYLKRFQPNRFGMRRTMQHQVLDKLAIISLWCIFPARLLAESFSAALYHNGSFLTNTVGKWLSFLPVDNLIYPAWWGYSIVLGIFFFSLPFSRYMHIPTEVLLIILRNAGIRSRYFNHPFQQVDIYACSRCGICIDACQLSTLGYATQPAYYLRSLRYKTQHNELTENCLLCGRCVEACPVGIFSTDIRSHERTLGHEMNSVHYNFSKNIPKQKNVEVLYFAGCMSHLVPGIKKAMTSILNQSGCSWSMLDEQETVCCGRPLLLAGQITAANQVIMHTRSLIERSHARILVTSCPICFKTFKENYRLNANVLHHSQFIKHLQDEQRIVTQRISAHVKYHDPCELGRGMNVYNEPREVLSHIAHLLPTNHEKNKSLCCGGSLGNIFIDVDSKLQIATNTLQQMDIRSADYLITACPLCQKTFSAVSPIPVKDIAQLVADNLLLANAENKNNYAMISENA
ncbi:MAG TPA: (Fe-S)-binding protein [Bacteroidales bacterium]|nr:(Fe-S)-binding protein [Bacteroidales bacterium]HPO65490.1 (Fe-S)-binding protein [Bacteroidales bacterium]